MLVAPMRADAAGVGGKGVELGAAAAGGGAARAAEVEEAPKAAAKVSVRTPQIHWHGKSPVFTVDFHPLITSLCATGGNEPDGSGGVKLWVVNPAEGGAVSAVSYVQDLVGHEKTVNCLRFSPAGDMLASAGVEGVIVLWRRTAAASTAEEALEGKEKWEYQTMLRAHTLDVCDLAWSYCSQFIASASVDNTASVFSVNRQEKTQACIRGHDHFVLGVAWDPQEEYLLTVSSDRSVRFHSSASCKWKNDSRSMHVATRMEFPTKGSGAEKVGQLSCVRPVSALAETDVEKVRNRNFALFLDDSVAAHRRRPAWSPDGLFAVVPGGLYQASATAPPVYVTHVLLRRSPKESFAFLPCGKEPSIAVRFCPTIFKLHPDRPGGSNAATPVKGAPVVQTHFNLPYRLVFAVATQDSVLVYDTQDMKAPLLYVTAVHFTPLTDLAWSKDGTYLIATSSDGYCTIIEFNPSELTEPLEPEIIEAHTKNYWAKRKAEEAVEEQAEEAAAAEPHAVQAVLDAKAKAAAPPKPVAKDDPNVEEVGTGRGGRKRRIIPMVVKEGGDAPAAMAGASGKAAPDTVAVEEAVVEEGAQQADAATGEAKEGDAGAAVAGVGEAGTAVAGAGGGEKGAESGAAEGGTGKAEAEGEAAPKKRRVIVPVVVAAAP